MRKNSKPLVLNDSLVTCGSLDSTYPIQVGSQAWSDWLTQNDGFTYKGNIGHFTARSELRRGIRYWYGYRRREGKLTKTYLGKPEELTLKRLEQASAILAGQVILGWLSNLPDTANMPPIEVLAEMSNLSLTKFKPPALSQKLITRPRLTQRINAPVTLISAPNGFGKTTLINEWRQTCGMPVAWVTLDSNDNHPQRFWASVVMALRTIDPQFGQGWISELRSSSPPSAFNTVINLINDIVQVTDKLDELGIGLVLDDFHHIQESRIHASIQTWLEQVPPRFQLIITSNTKLPLTLGFLRAKGTVVELKADDLRFTMEEGFVFLKQHTSGHPIADSDMQALIKRTEGWAAGLVLATSALSQQGIGSRVMEIFTGAHTYLREFFTESLWDQQPTEVQDFLLRTSILQQMTGSLCDSLTGRSDGERMLARLWEENLFLEQLDEPGWYRYHEMFAEMLRAWLQEKLPDEIVLLHRKAAGWYRAHNSSSEAIHHFLLIKSWKKAAALIEDVALAELEKFGEGSRLLRWLQQLPEEIIQQRKTLLVIYIRLAGLVLSPKEVDDFLSRAEKTIISMPASERTSDLLKTLSEIKRIRRLWATGNPRVLGLHSHRENDSVGQLLNGILQLHRDSRVDLVKAELKANEIYESAKLKGHLFSILMAGGACANLAFSQGHLRRSEQIAQRVLQQTTELHDKLPGPASIALTALSGVHFERNQVAQAHQLLERAVEVDPDPVSTDESIMMGILRAKIQSIQGDADAAFATIQSIRELYSHHSPNIWLDQDLIAYQALFRLHQGDLTSAERHLGGGWEIEKNPFSAFIRASILVQQNRNVAAEDILNHLLGQYPDGFYWVPILRARTMLATALFNQGKINQSRQVMAEAARIAAPEHFVRPFLSSDPQITTLLSLVLHMENINPGTRSFLKGTLTMLGHADDAQGTLNRDDPMPMAIAASISPREQQILYLLCTGLSNREIAERLSISESTVKTHLENIFRKLGVSSRTQAIAQAQALGLV